MKKTIQNAIQNIQRRTLTNNTQKVGLQLLSSGDWVPRTRLKTPSATARIRDLRKEAFGSFPEECKSSSQLNKSTSSRTDYYRINTSKVTKSQVETLFRKDI